MYAGWQDERALGIPTPLPKRRPINRGSNLAPAGPLLNFLKSITAKNPRANRGSKKPAMSVRERVSAPRHLPAFLKLIWHTSPDLALGNAVRG